jgi:DNA topoisomerase-1
MQIQLDRALELIVEKREVEANRLIKDFPENKEVQLLNGRYGAYLKIGKDNFKLPKGTEAALLTLEECLAIAADPANAPKKKPGARKAPAAKKPAAKKPAAKKPAAKKK